MIKNESSTNTSKHQPGTALAPAGTMKLLGCTLSKKRAARVVSVFIIAAFLLLSISYNFTAYGTATAAPQNVKIGLSYGSYAVNSFNLKSSSGLKVGIIDNAGTVTELFCYEQAAGITVRKDMYYNIVDKTVKEINYTKVAQYKGDVIGPYHIQIGDIYADINAAKQAAVQISSVAPSVFLVYEGGWRVWSQLYLDQDECLEQIQLMQNELKDFTFSVVAPDKNRIQILDGTTGQILYIINAEATIKVTPIAVQNTISTIEYNKVKYRGSILLKRLKDSDITVINELPFEQYLYGVVPSEVYASWNMEALKAQAVAARNFAIISMGRHNSYGFDLCNGQHCQAYKGYTIENKRTSQSVDETMGKLLYYDGKLVGTYYHSSSGGYTENSENVWGNYVPYLRAVEDKYGLGSPDDSWVKTLDKEYIKQKMIEYKLDIGDILDIIPLEISQYGRVTKVEIKGTKGSKVLDKEKIRSILGSSAIKSIWYTLSTDADISVKSGMTGIPTTQRTSGMYVVSATGVTSLSSSDNNIYVMGANNTMQTYKIIPDIYTFNGKGWGHGLGMSQYGAKGMADAGYTYIQILEYYYTGAKVQ